MLVLNNFNISNMKERTYNIKSDDVKIHHCNPHHYKGSENTQYPRLLPSNKTKNARFALPKSVKRLPWQPD